uniref:C2H2-type domain-containing protein n=1 Tax=viral metagenome TaxID=1070528 RepID=A0A6C0D175_9ZZZZ
MNIAKNRNEILPFFSCEKCGYKTQSKKDYNKHVTTAKHLDLTKNRKKSQNIFDCTLCNYHTTNRYDFEKHQNTTKHKKRVENPENTEKIENVLEDASLMQVELPTHDLLRDLIQTNKEMQQFLLEQQKEMQNAIMELAKNNQNSPTTIIQNNTSTNHFNLNFFLNEQCKNAINIQDFLDNIKLTVADIEATGRLGYVNGISRIFINKLKEMDVFTRPLHCTDLKRETVYIRDQNTWEKEKEEQPKLKKVVKIIAHKNLKQLPAWQEKNPEYAINNSPQNEEFTKLSLTCLGAFTDEEEERDTQKILRNVLRGIVVEKNPIGN